MLIGITIVTAIAIDTMVVTSVVDGAFISIGVVIAADESRFNRIYLLILLFFVISDLNILIIVVFTIQLVEIITFMACVT